MFNCPSRRAPIPYPNAWDSTTFLAFNAADNPADNNVAGRIDYAMNCGHQQNSCLSSAKTPRQAIHSRLRLNCGLSRIPVKILASSTI